MNDKRDSKSFLIYIPPSQEISDLLEKVNNRLRENHPSNTYLPIYKGKWHSHLMVYLSPMPIIKEKEIITIVSDLSKELSSFEVILSELEIADSNYLYVNVDEKSKIILENIHEQLVERLKSLRDATIKEKYLQKWDKFSEDEKYRIKTTGLPYIYVPHMTLGVFENRQEQEVAYSEALPFNLTGKKFRANKIEILTSVEPDYKEKEIILSRQFPQ